MPCSGWPDSSSVCTDCEHSRKRREVAEARLCAVLTVLERLPGTLNRSQMGTVLDQVDWKEAGLSRKNFEQWWAEHKEQDRKRRAREAQEAQEKRERERLEKQAREKLEKAGLTKEQAAVLGIKVKS